MRLPSEGAVSYTHLDVYKRQALGLKDYQFALIAFGVTLALSLAGILVYRRLSARRHPNG